MPRPHAWGPLLTALTATCLSPGVSKPAFCTSIFTGTQARLFPCIRCVYFLAGNGRGGRHRMAGKASTFPVWPFTGILPPDLVECQSLLILPTRSSLEALHFFPSLRSPSPPSSGPLTWRPEGLPCIWPHSLYAPFSTWQPKCSRNKKNVEDLSITALRLL